MANQIQIKRSTTNANPTGLANGELAYTSNGDVLFLGSPNGSVVAIAGQRTPGVLTANQALVANSTSAINQIIVANLVPTQIYANGGFGSNGQLLTSNGSSLFWQTLPPGVSGSNTQIQFNDSGNLNAAAGFTFDKTTNTVGIGSGTVNTTNYSGTANNANNLGGAAASVYVNTSGNFTVGGNLNLTGANNFFSQSIAVGANATVNTTSHFVGNATVNTNMTGGQIAISGATINSTIYTGTANNANNLGGAAASAYVNTSGNYTVSGNINFTGSNNQFTNVNVTTAVNVGANVIANTTQITVGNTSVFTSINSTAVNTGTLSTLGNTSIGGSVTITGNLTVSGSYNVVNGNTVAYSDNMLFLNQGILATITNVSGNGSVVTFTANNNFQAGWDVLVANVNPSSYNGTYTNITFANSTIFRVSNTNIDTYVSGGTARGQSESNPDVGFAAGYNNGTYQHAGFFRDYATGVWKVFDGYLPEPDSSIYIDQSNNSFNIAPFQANILYVGNTTVYGTVNTTNFSGTANNANNLGGQLPSYYTNATNITTGTLPDARLSSAVVNTSGNFTIGGNVVLQGTNNYFNTGFFVGANVTINTTMVDVGNATIYTEITAGQVSLSGATINATNYSGTANNANNLAGAAASAYVNTSGNYTVAGNINFTAANVFFTNINVGANVVVNTTSFFVGNTTVNTNITGGQISISGITVNSTIYQGTANNANNLNGQTAAFYTNATNITTGTLPMAQLGANVVNTSAAFTITGAHTYHANLVVGNSTVNVATSNSSITINAGNTATLNGSSLAIGNTTSNVVSNTTGFFVDGQAIYTNATNLSSGTLPDARLSAAVVNTSGNYTVAGNINFTGTNTNFTTVYSGANVYINTTSHFVGNSTVNTNITAGQISLSGVTINSTSYSGAANNTTYLNGQLASYYTNATNISTGTLAANVGGTGTTSYAVGDLLVANGTTSFRKMTVGTDGQVLQSNGTTIVYGSLDGGSF
jgi:hypothetical protein